MPRFEPGCYGDGSLGHDHVRARIADVIASLRRRSLGVPLDVELIASLRGPMPDDASDEDQAIDLLNDRHAPDGYVWGFQDGDFGLWAEDDQ